MLHDLQLVNKQVATLATYIKFTCALGTVNSSHIVWIWMWQLQLLTLTVHACNWQMGGHSW